MSRWSVDPDNFDDGLGPPPLECRKCRRPLYYYESIPNHHCANCYACPTEEEDGHVCGNCLELECECACPMPGSEDIFD